MSQMETLISTLIQNGLASSRSEAQRMASDMMSTSNKVTESMKNTNVIANAVKQSIHYTRTTLLRLLRRSLLVMTSDWSLRVKRSNLINKLGLTINRLLRS